MLRLLRAVVAQEIGQLAHARVTLRAHQRRRLPRHGTGVGVVASKWVRAPNDTAEEAQAPPLGLRARSEKSRVAHTGR